VIAASGAHGCDAAHIGPAPGRDPSGDAEGGAVPASDDRPPLNRDPEERDRVEPGELQDAFRRARRRAAAVPQAVREHVAAGRRRPDGPAGEQRPPTGGA
jgi:hypothetical protein